MPNPSLPNGYHNLQPYLIVQDAPQALAFYKRALNATERMIMHDDKGRISHAELQFGDSVLMLAEEHPEIEAWAPAHYGGSPINLMLYVDHCDTVYQQALNAGATSLREPADQPYGDRMSGVLDPFGFKWWIAHPLPQAATANQPEQAPGH